MKVSLVTGLLIGSIGALRIVQNKGWVELPDCPATLTANDIPLAADTSNASKATCKVRVWPPAAKPIGQTAGGYIWSPVQVAAGG